MFLEVLLIVGGLVVFYYKALPILLIIQEGNKNMIPSDKEKRARLLKYVEQSANLRIEVDTIREDLAEISNMVKEEFDMPKTEFKVLVDAQYDKNVLESKIEEMQTGVSNLEILKGE